METERQVTIYALCEPDTNEIRYIGQTVNIKRRLYEHVNSPKVGNKNKQDWVQSLLAQGQAPLLKILCIVNRAAANQAETDEIARATQDGANLLNSSLFPLGGGWREKEPSPTGLGRSLNCAPTPLMTKRIVSSFQMNEADTRKFEALKAAGFGGLTEVVRTALDRMFMQEIGTMNTHNAWVERVEELRQMVSDLNDAPTVNADVEYLLDSPDFFGGADFDDDDRTVLRREMQRQYSIA